MATPVLRLNIFNDVSGRSKDSRKSSHQRHIFNILPASKFVTFTFLEALKRTECTRKTTKESEEGRKCSLVQLEKGSELFKLPPG